MAAIIESPFTVATEPRRPRSRSQGRTSSARARSSSGRPKNRISRSSSHSVTVAPLFPSVSPTGNILGAIGPIPKGRFPTQNAPRGGVKFRLDPHLDIGNRLSADVNDPESDHELLYHEIYPYPPAPSTDGPFQIPTLAPLTRAQNARLTALANLLNKSYIGEGRDQGNRNSGTNRMQRGDRARYTFADDDAYAGFEKNFAEVQKLLERAKYLDERGYNNTSVAAADVEKKRRRVENFTRSNQQAHQQMLELMSDNKSLAGRKPIRVIAAELSKRIETLKSNQTEWESFQARILEYRATDAKNTRGVTLDAVQQNKQNVRHLRPEVRRQTRKELAAEHDHHREEVFNRKREQDLFLWRERVASLRKKEADLGQSKKPEEQLGRAQTLQKKWLIITSVASRLAMMRIVLEASRAERSERARRNRAARVIQKAYRRHKSLRQERKKREALTTIAVVFRIYIRRRRERMKHSASNTIRQFFRDVYDVSKLMKVVKKYRFSVVKCQSYVRSWRAIIDCQVEVLCRYWDKLEPLWWAQRKQNAGARASSAVEVDDKKDKKKEKVDKSKGAKTKGKSRKDESSDKVFLKVADTTKRALLREDLLARRKQHRKLVKQFEQDSLRDLKSGTTISSQPKPPLFKLLPSQPDMYSLIEKGHLTAY